MSWTERYMDSASTGGDGTTAATSGTNAAWADFGAAITGVAAVITGMGGTITAPIRVNIKAGTYANTSTTRTFASAGTSPFPIWWRGYKTTVGDQDTNRAAVAGTDVPLLTYTTGQMAVSGAHHILSSLAITSQCTTGNGALVFSAANPILYGVRVENTATNAAARALTLGSSSNAATIVACWFKAATTTPPLVVSNGGATNVMFLGCVFRGGSSASSSGTVTFVSCTFDGQTSDALTISNISIIANCSVYGPGGNGINVTTVPANGVHISNCHFENCNAASKAGINNTTGTNSALVHVVNCSFFNCTSNTGGITETFAIFDQGTLGASGFTNAAGRDFTASTSLKAIGYPGTLENETLTGYLDTGALQRQEPTASPTHVINQIINRYYLNEGEI